MNIPFLRPLRPRPAALLWLAAAVAGPATAQSPAVAGAQLPAETLARATALVVEAATALAPAGARVMAQPGTLDARLTLAPCARIEPYLSAGLPAWGRTRVGLRCTDGPTRWSVFLPVTVQVWAPAPALTAALPAGARLTQEQLSPVDTDWAAGAQAPLADMQALQGRTLARPLAAGQALRQADLQPRQWFATGEVVRIVATGNGYAISTEGQALTPGFEGQNARVRTDGGRVLVVRPVGERRVEVAL